MNKTIIYILIALLGITAIAVISYNSFSKNDSDDVMNVMDKEEDTMMIDDSMDKGEDSMMVDDSMDKNDDSMMVDDSMNKDDNVMMKSGIYTDYDFLKLTDDTNIIFFHANWCPTCKALNANIESNLIEIPSNVILLKTDYDKETELKKKYGVTIQHTLVQVDKSGNMIKKWSGSETLQDLLTEI